MSMPQKDLASLSRTLVRSAGMLARFCDRAEHNEGADRAVVIDAGVQLRACALRVLVDRGQDPVAAYATRLAALEARHPLSRTGLYDADEALRHVKTWRGLQQGQARHDAVYHPDVNGLAKIDQLRHYTLHLSKLAWLLTESAAGDVAGPEDVNDRVTDVLVFGVKLATVCGQTLPDDPIDVELDRITG